MKIHDKEFELFIDEYELDDKISEFANRITNEFEFGEPPVILGVLDGSFRFLGDLAYHVAVECEWSFIKLTSMDGTTSTGDVKQLIGLKNDIKDKVVIIVEDIVDTGITIEHVVEELRKYKPREIRIMTLLFKPDAYKGKLVMNYIGFEIPNDFVVGYGLDYDGYGRGSNDIYKLKENDDKRKYS